MGKKTLNEMFYKLAYGANGLTEYNKYIDNLDVADAEIKANKDAKHTQNTDTALATLTAGIPFPATQVPSANANTLDDYEEGTWTPAFKFGGNSVNMTYDVQGGRYTKIGNIVNIRGRLSLTAKGSSTGAATITGLPFTCKNSPYAYAVVSMRLDRITYANVFQGIVMINTTTISLGEITEAGVQTALDNTNFANDSNMIINVTYEVD